MFSYRPPKGSCWGHALRPRDPAKSAQKLRAFMDTYFEPCEPEKGSLAQTVYALTWKTAVLPNIEWTPDYLKPGNEKFRCVLLMLTTLMGSPRAAFPMGITIPISSAEPESYDFLQRFSADAPFKMSAKHFQVCVPIGKKGGLAWRKPDAAIAARLQEVI